MKQFELYGKTRKTATKGALNDLRKEGFVPGILYGGEENVNVYFFINDVKKVLYTKEVYLLNLTIEEKKYKAIVKETKYHPLSDEPIHIDLMEVTENKVVKVNYPLNFVGTPVGSREGGNVFKKMRIIRLKGRVADLPDQLDIDITPLKLGETLKVRDITIPEIEIQESGSTPVVGVARSKAAISANLEAEAAEAAGEGEGEGEGEAAEGTEGTKETQE